MSVSFANFTHLNLNMVKVEQRVSNKSIYASLIFIQNHSNFLFAV